MSMDMLDSISAPQIYAEIIMQRDAAPHRAILLVEGVEDVRALGAYVNHELCRLMICHGNEALLGAMQRVNERGDHAVAALTDSDCGNAANDLRLTMSGVITTDRNDLDAEILHMPGLVDRLVWTHCDGLALLRLIADSEYSNVLEAMGSIVAPVTCVRYMCGLHSLSLNAKDLPILAIYQRGMTLDRERLAQAIISRLPMSERASRRADVETWLDLYEINGVHIPDLHNGHLLFNALHAILRIEGGSKSSAESLVNAARAAITWEELFSLPFIRRLTDYFNHFGVWIWCSH